MSVAELEAQIRETPDDVELRAVHADAVLERGEPGDRVRGQLIHLALRGERGDAAAAREAWSMQRKARARLVNALDRRYVLRLGWKHGSVESISLELRMWSGATSLHQARTTAALEDRRYPLDDLLFDSANLFAGDRFSGTNPRRIGRLADACTRAYRRLTIDGWLHEGIPTQYGSGASESVRALSSTAEVSEPRRRRTSAPTMAWVVSDALRTVPEIDPATMGAR